MTGSVGSGTGDFPELGTELCEAATSVASNRRPPSRTRIIWPVYLFNVQITIKYGTGRLLHVRLQFETAQAWCVQQHAHLRIGQTDVDILDRVQADLLDRAFIDELVERVQAANG